MSRAKIVAAILFGVLVFGVVQLTRVTERDEIERSTGIQTGLSLAETIKVRIIDYHQSRGVFPNSNYELGIGQPATLASGAVKSVAVDSGGVITVVFNAKVADGSSLRMTPKVAPGSSALGGIEWQCTTSTIAQHYFEHTDPPCIYAAAVAP